MKKALTCIVFLLILSLSGCQTIFSLLQEEPKEEEEKTVKISGGTHPDNLIPLGEAVTITTKDYVMQLKIKEIIDGERASQLLDTEEPCMVVIFNMQVSNLTAGESVEMGAFDMILNNGLRLDKNLGGAYSLSKALNLPLPFEVRFEADGASDIAADFYSEIGNCKYLKYKSYDYKNEIPYIYFALK